jgi:hypothetical protein
VVAISSKILGALQVKSFSFFKKRYRQIGKKRVAEQFSNVQVMLTRNYAGLSARKDLTEGKLLQEHVDSKICW